jgi:hypothetical protein
VYDLILHGDKVGDKQCLNLAYSSNMTNIFSELVDLKNLPNPISVPTFRTLIIQIQAEVITVPNTTSQLKGL